VQEIGIFRPAKPQIGPHLGAGAHGFPRREEGLLPGLGGGPVALDGLQEARKTTPGRLQDFLNAALVLPHGPAMLERHPQEG
jgi:hypothetical protein